MAKLLSEVHRKLPILKTIAWPVETRERFFASGERELPVVAVRGYDPSVELDKLRAARAMVRGTGGVAAWLRRSNDTLSLTATMLAAAGTPSFSKHSQRLYGRPSDPFPATERTPLETARRLIRTTHRVNARLPDPPPAALRADEVAEEIRAAVRAHFGDKAPRVEVVTALGARAAAAPKRIRLRRNARFSDLDVRQLIHHEAFVHVATALNGKAQRKMPLLAANHAGTTRTQEGLAVFAELISGALDPVRLLRLAHRVTAVQMTLDGADFLQVYAYFREHSTNAIEAYESTVRIFRGGGRPRGGSPFTKDMVYLDGLVRVHVFIRAVIDTGRVDALRLLFAGKLDLVDIPTLMELTRAGMCVAPRFVPPWVTDPRRLVAYFAVSDVIGRAATAGLRSHYVDQLNDAPDMIEV